MNGLTMDFPLTLDLIFRRAPLFYGYREVVSKTPSGLHRYTYGDFYVRTRRLMGALEALGMEKGDRVATFALNSYRHLELYFGVPCAGGVLHTLNIRLSPDHLEYIVGHAGDRFIFVDAALVPLLEPLVSRLGSVEGYVVMGDVPEGTVLAPVYAYEELVAGSPERGPPRLEERDAAAMCYTSGTTGSPKGVLYDHRAILLHSFASCTVDSVAISEGDSMLVVVPQFHANAWGMPFSAVMTGAKQVYPGPFMQPADLAQLLESESVTIAAGVPTLWIALYQYLKENPTDTSALTRLVVGGSAMPAALIEAFDKDFGIHVLHAWGMTETAPLGSVARLKSTMASLPEAERFRLRAKQGLPPPGIEMRIRNEAGEELPWDGATVGEVEVRGPWVAGRYFRNPSADASFTDDGWFRTGDVATMDEHGFMHITDRTKDLIKSGGEWISSVELENAIMGHPKIVECAVIAVPHERWVERPLAVAVLAAGEAPIALEDLHGFLRDKVAKWWLPDRIQWVEELPKTSVGKFDKKVLRRTFAGEEAVRPGS